MGSWKITNAYRSIVNNSHHSGVRFSDCAIRQSHLRRSVDRSRRGQHLGHERWILRYRRRSGRGSGRPSQSPAAFVVAEQRWASPKHCRLLRASSGARYGRTGAEVGNRTKPRPAGPLVNRLRIARGPGFWKPVMLSAGIFPLLFLHPPTRPGTPPRIKIRVGATSSTRMTPAQLRSLGRPREEDPS